MSSGAGGPRLVQAFRDLWGEPFVLLTLKDALESLHLPYVIFGPDTPVTQVAEYAARFAKACRQKGDD